MTDENHPSANHYQVKKRAESYNKQRENDELDQLMQDAIEDNQVEFEYI